MKKSKAAGLIVLSTLMMLNHKAFAADTPINGIKHYSLPPIRISRGTLRQKSNTGYEVELLSSPVYTRRLLLLSIDGENLTNLTLKQIQKKLFGPNGSKVKIELVHNNGQVETLDLTRQPVRNELEQILSPGELRRDIETLGSDQQLFNSIGNHPPTNVDLIAKASNILAVDSLNRSILSNRSRFDNLMQSALLSQSIGDFGAADNYLSDALIQTKTKFSPEPGLDMKFPLNWAVRNLVALGRVKDAELICSLRGAQLSDGLLLLSAYSLISTDEAKHKCTDLANQKFSEFLGEYLGYQQTEECFWLCDFLEKLGWKDKSLSLYTNYAEKLRPKPESEYTFTSSQPLAYALYCKARLEAAIGKRNQAKADLDSITAIFKANFSPAQMAVLDRVPGIFPRPKDVVRAKAALTQSLPVPHEPITTPFVFHLPSDYMAFPATASITLQFPNAVKCFEAIQNGNQKAAEELASILLHSFESQSPDSNDPQRQNLFSTLMRFARTFSDRGWYESSDKVLTRLREINRANSMNIGSIEVADALVDAELVYNAHCSGQNLKNRWETFQQTYHLSDKDNAVVPHERRKDYSWTERLRMLAMAYHFAEEPKRAKFFIMEAVEPTQEIKMLSTCQSQTDEAFLLMMDAACILAAANEMSACDSYIQKALSEPFRSNRYTNSAIIETAKVLAEKSETAKAISLLKAGMSAKDGYDFHETRKKMDSLMAELLNRSGNISESAKVLEDSITRHPHSIPGTECFALAKSFEDKQDFLKALKFYELAAGTHGMANEQSLEASRKAVECALKIKGLDDKKLCDAYLALAGKLEFKNSHKESLAAREKALALMKDSDPRKPSLLSVNAYIRNQLRKEALGVRGPALDAPSPPTPDQLSSAREAARLASQNNLPDASHYWLRLAMFEAELKQVDQAVEHALRGIAAYSRKDPAATNPEQIFRYDPVSRELAEVGALDKGKLLFKEAIKKVEEVMGAGSIEAQAQMAQYFEFLASHKQFADAEALLDAFLKTDLKQGHYSPPNYDVTVCRMGPPSLDSSLESIEVIQEAANATVTSTDNTFALKVLDKLLQEERKQFGNDDRRVALTMVCIARAHSKRGEYSQAESVYRNALNILKIYEPMVHVMNVVNPDFYDVLRQLKKYPEIKIFEKDIRRKGN